MTSLSPPHFSRPTAAISAQRKNWHLPAAGPDPDFLAALARELRLPPLIAALLAQRGFTTAPAAHAFLHPEFKSLHNPALLPNMQPAVERLARAIANKEKIILFGDYDVDGITGTAMLWHILRAAGAADRVQIYIPHRVDEGYGLSCPAIEKVLADGNEGGGQLIVTIDCGISAIEPIKLARSRNVDVIITDHHDFSAEFPPANAIVHPRVPSSSETGNQKLETPYPNPDLCGAGVAYKLAWALATHLCGGGKVTAVFRDLLIEFAALVALATIADVVPLVGENRVLVKYGLLQLGRTNLTGLRALKSAAGYGDKLVDCTAVGFGLAPRLNAAGRMDHAQLAVELLTTAGPERAQEIAEYLEQQNKDRRTTEARMLVDAEAQISEWLKSGITELPRVLVVHSTDHHAGVVGIVASRLVERYHRPTFVLAEKPMQNDSPADPIAAPTPLMQGSARSITGFDLHAAIEHCREHLISGGGHAMAGGVKLHKANIQIFRDALNHFAESRLTPEHLIPAAAVDGVLSLSVATIEMIRWLSHFAPFGRGNPHPRLLIDRARLTAPPRAVGATGAHLQMQFAQDRSFGRGIAFRTGPLSVYNDLPVGLELDLVVEPRIDTYGGRERVDFIITDFARCDGEPLRLEPEKTPATTP